MVRHNNVIPNQHFKKKWQFYVKTWFNQPARKKRRSEGETLITLGRVKAEQRWMMCRERHSGKNNDDGLSMVRI